MNRPNRLFTGRRKYQKNARDYSYTGKDQRGRDAGIAEWLLPAQSKCTSFKVIYSGVSIPCNLRKLH